MASEHPEHAAGTPVTLNKSPAQLQTTFEVENTSNTQMGGIKIKDGRRNSEGEVLESPTGTWQPRINRTQSWNREDMKREVFKEMVEREVAVDGEEVGYTEVEFSVERSG